MRTAIPGLWPTKPRYESPHSVIERRPLDAGKAEDCDTQELVHGVDILSSFQYQCLIKCLIRPSKCEARRYLHVYLLINRHGLVFGPCSLHG